MYDKMFEGNEELAEKLEKAREAVSMSAEADQLLEELQEDVIEEEAAGLSSTRREPLPIEGRLTTTVVRVPPEIKHCTGIVVHGHRLRSFIYSTDVAVIRNTNADAILAVYPFTGHPVITQAIISVARTPVFTGIGGGTTTGRRVLELAMFAEMQGVQGVVLNAPSSVETVEYVASTVDVPVVATILGWDDVARAKIEAGARIVNVAAGRETANVVRRLREEYPEFPVIATGGKTGESILETIEAGANAISWTPPAVQDLQSEMMDSYRAGGLGVGHHGTSSDEVDDRRARMGAWFVRNGM